MAVALGFDAPRAWTLVSMRGIVDEDFGTQIVGRLMRVHELCQGKTLPDALNHAYVFLADMESQKGLEQAADKLNRVKTQLASVAAYSVVVQVGGENQLQVIRNGQPELLPDEKTRPALEDLKPTEEEITGGDSPPPPKPQESNTGWFGLFGQLEGNEQTSQEPAPGESKAEVTQPPAMSTASCRYSIRQGVPTRFRKESIKKSIEGLEEAIVAHVDLNAEVVLDGLRRAVDVLRIEKGLFENQVREDSRSQIQAALDRQATESQAQQLVLNVSGIVDPRKLDSLLLKRVTSELARLGRSEAGNPDEVEYTLSMILVQRPKLLRQALKRALANYIEVVDSGPLAAVLSSNTPLPSSAGNIYGVMPHGMNTWEIAFAEWLDREALGVVNWWHRNVVFSEDAVTIALPDGARFFPDFVISIKGRNKPDGILLVDTKRAINDDLNAIPKAIVQHQEYGRAMILRKDGHRWMTVRYSEEQDKNLEDQVLHPELLAHFV